MLNEGLEHDLIYASGFSKGRILVNLPMRLETIMREPFPSSYSLMSLSSGDKCAMFRIPWTDINNVDNAINVQSVNDMCAIWDGKEWEETFPQWKGRTLFVTCLRSDLIHAIETGDVMHCGNYSITCIEQLTAIQNRKSPRHPNQYPRKRI